MKHFINTGDWDDSSITAMRSSNNISKRDVAISNEPSEEEITNKEDLDISQVKTNFNFKFE